MVMFKPISALLAILLIASVSFAQGTIKRTPDGKPDPSGVWQTGGISLSGGPQGNVVAPGPAAPAAGARGGAPAGGGARGAGGAAPAAGARGGGGGQRGGGGGAPAPGALSMQQWAAEKAASFKN